ncbi:hypothetical protein [uncultured Paludibaculum sp.]|uniref:hypothetical protein n=1 Tax=uncultured Paludibaculum sp. TaxID=1765020 RepID=UPI002AAAF43D|nr:hypothetical protein [uncultured Paludibaculum sp.]
MLQGFPLATIALTLSLLQAPVAEDRFAPVRFLEGRWKGVATGEPGRGVSEREYRFEMKGRFLSVRNKSTWEIVKGKTEPEIHEDWGMFSYDRNMKVLVLRQFHIEGFVNEYRLTASTPESREFTTFQIENLPAGFRAREVYRIVSKDEFVESFSIAEPGKDFQPYSETRFQRIR